MKCDWPFHHDPDCLECKQWEAKYVESLTKYMDQTAEVRAAAKVAKRRTTPPTASA